MANTIDHSELDQALRRCGASWNAERAHGLLCSRLSVFGSEAGVEWLQLVLRESESGNTPARECGAMLETLFTDTHQQLSERLSDFAPLLPQDDDSTRVRAEALAHWCEGFLHGLISDVRSERLKAQLASEPLSDIIRDLLQITRASADDDSDIEDNDVAYMELVEYLRVAVQLTYEELGEFRASLSSDAMSDGEAPVLH